MPNLWTRIYGVTKQWPFWMYGRNIFEDFCWKITKDCRLSSNYLDRLGFGLEVEQFCFNIITCTFCIVFQVWCRGTRWIEGSSKHKRGLGLEKEIPRVIILEFFMFSKIVIYKLCWHQSFPNIKRNQYLYIHVHMYI